MGIDFFTIGVYGSTESSFFGELQENKIEVFLDVRQRRGVRGSQYSYVNSKRLQKKLSEIGIEYFHVSDLAPSKEIREFQKVSDTVNGTLKSTRTELGPIFKMEYTKNVLCQFDMVGLLSALELKKAQRVVLFCVEEHHKACHRSIISDLLDEKFGYQTIHL